MKITTINVTTGESVERDMTAEELAEFEQMRLTEQGLKQELDEKMLNQFNEQVLLNTLLQTFVGYLGLHLQGKLPVVTFADFMGEVFSRYMQNGGTITP